MEYESDLGVFSPDGRLIQVEYAQHASNQGVTIVLQCLESSIHIAYEKRSTNPLVIPMSKIHEIDLDRHFCLIFSGFKADSLCVIDEALNIVHNYKHTTSEDISLEILARKISEYKQTFTVDSYMRPYGLRTVLFGIEKNIPKIFVIETDGNFAEYIQFSLGFRNEVCNSYLEAHQEPNSAFKALAEVVQMDHKKISGFSLDQNGIKEFSNAEIEQLIK